MNTPNTSGAVRTVRLYGLRSVDTAVAELFLKIVRQQTCCQWVLSEQAQVDVLLVSPQHVDAREMLSSHAQIVWVTPRDVQLAPDGRPHLTQPLQLESFLEVLRAAEQRPPVAESETPSSEAVQDEEQAAVACRLLRWPQAQVLAAHRYYPRLASFLSSRYLTIQQLATLSNVSWQVCVEFIKQMRNLGLLDVRENLPQTARSRVQAVAASAGAAVQNQGAVVSGLIGRLRERLGLQNTAQPAHMGLAR